MAMVATMNALPAFIVGFPWPAHLSTTSATSAFVVATKDSPLTHYFLQVHIIWPATTFRGDPGDNLVRIHDVASLAVNTIGRIQL